MHLVISFYAENLYYIRTWLAISYSLPQSLTSPSLSAAVSLGDDERKWRHQRLPLAGSVGRQPGTSPGLHSLHLLRYWRQAGGWGDDQRIVSPHHSQLALRDIKLRV